MKRNTECIIMKSVPDKTRNHDFRISQGNMITQNQTKQERFNGLVDDDDGSGAVYDDPVESDSDATVMMKRRRWKVTQRMVRFTAETKGKEQQLLINYQN